MGMDLNNSSSTYSSLTQQQKQQVYDTARAGVQINRNDRVLEWDPTDIVCLLPALHRMSDSLLSNFLANKLFVMIEEEPQQNGIPACTCNMEVQQLMTEPLVETFLRCKYDQLYPDILSSEVILCPVLHRNYWYLVAIFFKEKRMVYLDSLFHGVRAAKAFECLHNFIECGAKVQGKKSTAERDGNFMS